MAKNMNKDKAAEKTLVEVTTDAVAVDEVQTEPAVESETVVVEKTEEAVVVSDPVQVQPAVEEKTESTPEEKSEPVIAFLVVKVRHNQPYRRAGFIFDALETKLDIDDLSEETIQMLNNDPHLLVHFEAAD